MLYINKYLYGVKYDLEGGGFSTYYVENIAKVCVKGYLLSL